MHQVPDEGHNLEAALERFSAVDILDGDNMYNCERCERLVRAYRSTRIDVAPNVLQICLKRYRHMVSMTWLHLGRGEREQRGCMRRLFRNVHVSYLK
jgi:ubiquitin C-terminal hydrolase